MKKKEEDLFTWNVQKQEEKKTHLVQSTQPPQYKDTLFPLENLTDTQTKKIPSPIKPVVITHHKKDDMTPDLPGLEFERE